MPRNDGKEDDRIMESLILCKYDIKNIMAFSSDQREITPLWTCLPYEGMVSSIPTITEEDTRKGKTKLVGKILLPLPTTSSWSHEQY
jgi:hypothetical protein